MSKNLTRKGLALGALVGLASTAIAGTPAFAANELTFALSSGTVYAAPVDDTLTLNASLPSSIPAANVSQLKYKVVTDSTFVAKVVASSGPAPTVVTKYTNTANATSVGTGLFTGVNTTTYVVPSSNINSTSANTIAISVDAVAGATVAADGAAPTSATATKTVTVTAFLDSNNNGTFEDTEFNTVQTLSFKKYSEITATYTLTAPSAGATSVKGTATFTNINQAQLTKAVTVLFSKNGTASGAAIATGATSPSAFAVSSAGVYSATDGGATFSGGLTAGDVVGVQALIATAALGSTEVTATATARTIDSIGTAAVVAGDNSTAAGKFRDGGAFTVRTKVTKSSAAVAGISGTATFSTGLSALSDTVYVTVNGTAYKTKTALEAASLALTSDASGYLSVTITTTGFTTGTVIVNFAAQNYTNSVTATGEVAVYYAVDIADSANVNARNLLSSATTTVTYQVMDQYGVAPADSTFRAVLVPASGTNSYQAVAGGKAAFTVTGGTASSLTYTVGLEKWVASSASYAAYSAGSANDDGFTVYKAAAANVSAAGSLTATTTNGAGAAFFASSGAKLTLSDQAFSSVDTRLDKKTAAPTLAKGYSGGTVTAPTTTTGSLVAGDAAVTITVTAKGSDVAATPIAAPVTVSGKGLLFQIGTTVFATDSISFLAASGGTPVKVYSHTAGDNVITITSGTATKTVTLNYAAIAAEAAAVVYGTLPAQAQAGRAVDLSAIVKDQWGNVVPGALVAFTNTGVGYVQSTAQVTSDANGKVAGRLIVLQNDFGTSYLSATLDLATDVVIAKSIEFGLTDVDVVAGGHRVFVNAEFALGRTVTVTIDGVRVYSKIQTSDNAVELAFTQKKKGAHTVTVRISGGIVATERVTTN
jgi:hypothetical protein